MSKYLVIDLETTGTKTYKRFCNPLDPNHSITMWGFKYEGNGPETMINPTNYSEGLVPGSYFKGCEVKLMIGQNFKFDMLWFWNNRYFQDWIREGGKVWDTQTVQYLLDAQQQLPRHLDDLSLKYGGKIKDDRIGVMFKAGILANEIDPDIMGPYCRGDVENTEIVMLGQAKEAKKRGKLNLIKVYMDHYLALTEIEYNGLYINGPALLKRAVEVAEETEILEESIKRNFLSISDWPENAEFNIRSNNNLSAILFGDVVKYRERVTCYDSNGKVIIVKTTGQIKTRWESKQVVIKGMGFSTSLSSQTQAGLWATNDKVLQKIVANYSLKSEIVSQLVKYNKKRKYLSTYLHNPTYDKDGELLKATGYYSLIQPHSGCIHSSFDTTVTSTGRLSSSKPNVQNMDPAFTEFCTSRWGDKGVIVEFDYSQIEIIVQAFIAQSENMLQDIRDGVDFHCKRLSYIVDQSYEEIVQLVKTSSVWKEKRSYAKVISFQKSYGASSETVAEGAGLSQEETDEIFQKEEEEYPEIGRFLEMVEESVRHSRIVLPELINIKDRDNNQIITREGEQAAVGFYTDILGQTYAFKEQASIPRGRRSVWRWFPSTEMRSFPVQGFAAAILKMMQGKLFRFAVHHRDKFLMVNEVHDSSILDMKLEYVDLLIPQIKSILEDVQGEFKRIFDIEFNAPIKVEVSYGKTWKKAKDSH